MYKRQVFEETGRLIAMKFWMKKWLDFPNALMYGIGHGGVAVSYTHLDVYKRQVQTGKTFIFGIEKT